MSNTHHYEGDLVEELPIWKYIIKKYAHLTGGGNTVSAGDARSAAELAVKAFDLETCLLAKDGETVQVLVRLEHADKRASWEEVAVHCSREDHYRAERYF